MPTADKKPPVNQVNVEYIEDFSGGLNSTISGSLLNKNEAQLADNVSFEQKGTLRPRQGRHKRYPVTFSPNPVTGLGAYYKSDGTSRLIISSGSEVVYDKPHISNRYDSQEDFEKAGTSKTSRINTSLNPGSIVFTGSLLGTTGNCENIASWSVEGGVATLDETVKVYGTYGIAMKVSTGFTVAKMKLTKSTNFNLNTNKAHCIGAWLKNKDLATGVRLVAYDSVGTVIKASDYVTATTMTWAQLKLTTTEVVRVYYIGIEFCGAVDKIGYVDGIVAYPIEQADYDNAGYVMPKYDVLMEVTNINKVYQPSIAVAKGEHIINNEVSTGTLTNIEVMLDGNITIDTKLTFEPYVAMTFDQMIAL